MISTAAHAHRPYQRHEPETTVLYQTLASHAETFIAARAAEGRELPKRVVKELRDYLRCGILQYGFVRTHCPSCKFERIVAFSCKGRGFCPSCAGKRMSETAVHLLDEVLPIAPYRQFVLTMPIPLRYWLAASKKLLSAVHRLTVKELFRWQIVKARKEKISDPRPGMITFIQRSGSALNLNVHFHIVSLEGVYAKSLDEKSLPKFFRLPPPSDGDVAELVEKISSRIIRHLKKKGYVQQDGELVERPDFDPLFQDHPVMADAASASIQSKIAFGPRAGNYVRRIGPGFGYQEEIPLIKGRKCASIKGFNLHAATHVGPAQRQQLFQLIKYLARPPLCNARLSRLENGDLQYTLKRAWSNGTSAIVLSPSELIEKLVAMIPSPRSHLVRHSGVFSSHSKLRPLIVPNPKARKGFNPEKVDKRKVKNHKWAKLLMRIFKVDVGSCPRCGTDLLIMGAVQSRDSIRRYLRSIGMLEHPPPIAAARYVQDEIEYGQ